MTEGHDTLMNLSTSCLRSVGSVLILLENDSHWDAEIVLRSVVEGTIKFAYMLSDPSEYRRRLKEYGRELFDISLLKTHDRAKAVIDLVQDNDLVISQSLFGVLMSDQEYEELKIKYPRQLRQEMDRRWGFVSLIEKLTKSDFPVSDYFPMLLHGYGMSSHLQHADAVGVDMVHERERRPEPRKSAANLAQIARVISDASSYTYFRLLFAYWFAKKNIAPVHEVWAKYNGMFEDINAAQREWAALEFRAFLI